MKKSKKPDRERIPASVLFVSIVTAVVILAVCAAVFVVMFNSVKNGSL